MLRHQLQLSLTFLPHQYKRPRPTFSIWGLGIFKIHTTLNQSAGEPIEAGTLEFFVGPNIHEVMHQIILHSRNILQKTRRKKVSIPMKHHSKIPMRRPHKTFTRRHNLNFDPRLLDTTHLNEALNDFPLPTDSLINNSRIIGNLILKHRKDKLFRDHLGAMSKLRIYSPPRPV